MRTTVKNIARPAFRNVHLGSKLNLSAAIFQDGDAFDKGYVSLHLDDAFESVYTNALPLMTTKGIKSTIYVNSKNVGGSDPNHGNYCSWAQIKELQAAGHDIQCHGAYGGSLVLQLTDPQINEEYYALNADFIANGLAAPKHTAYSGGDFNDHTLNITDNYRKSGRSTVSGYITRKTGYYTLFSESLPPSTIDALKLKMDYALATKTAITLYAHNIGVESSGLNTTVAVLTEIIDYAQQIGLEFITHAQLYDKLFYLDLRLSRDCPDGQIDVICNSKLPNYAKICIERSTDNLNFTEITRIDASDIVYSDTGLDFSNYYYYRVRGYVQGKYLPYTNVQEFRESFLTLTAQGGSVATLELSADEGMTFEIEGDANFYTNAAATEGESKTWKIVPQDYSTIYIKCTTGVSNLKVPKNKIRTITKYEASSFAPSLGGDISHQKSISIISIAGSNTLSGNIANFLNLKILTISGGNTLSGDISNLLNLEVLENTGASNTLSGDITLLTKLKKISLTTGSNRFSGSISQHLSLEYIYTSGLNLIGGDIANLTRMQYCNAGNSLVEMSTVALLPNLCYLKNSSLVILSSANINQLLADVWANRDAAKPRTERYLGLGYTNSSGAPTGQGLTDKANLQAYRSPNNDAQYALWTVTTK